MRSGISNLKSESAPLPGRRRGLTFVELVIGLAITAMVAGAVSAVMTAVSRGWQQGREADTGTSRSTVSVLRIQKILRSAKQIGACRVGALNGTPSQAAAVMIWKGDLNGDGKVQLSETALLEHQPNSDPDSAQIVYWEVNYPTSWNTAQKQAADSTLADDAIYDGTQIDTFKTLSTVHSTAQATRVTAAEFHRIDSATAVRAGLEFALKFDQDGQATVKYGRTTSRTAATLPASQQ